MSIDLGTPGEGMPRIGETFEQDGRRYRVEGFYKEFEPVRGRRIADDIIERLVDEIRAEDDGENKIQVIPCLRYEAQYISGYGVCGCIVPLEHVSITGRVNWSDERIEKVRGDWEASVCRDKHWPITIDRRG